MQHRLDERSVMTLDAGGTNFVFSALAAGREVATPVRMPTQSRDLEACLDQILTGFAKVKTQLAQAPVAISFAFPGPADYERGIIGDLGNLTCFRGGVALGPMLEEAFGIPVFINNDGDLFAYGEGKAGFLPYVNRRLEEAGSSKRYQNLLAVTLGTGLGGGLFSRGRLHTGDNAAGLEIWCNRDPAGLPRPCEEKISIRAVRREYAELTGIPFDDAPEPKDIYRIATSAAEGPAAQAREAFARLGRDLGEVLADLSNAVDGLVVVGGGLAGAHSLILPAAVQRMNEPYSMPDARSVPRMESVCYNLEDPADAQRFLRVEARMIRVPRSTRTIPYDPHKRIGIGISRLGTSEAIAIGAHAYALERLDRG
jgi:glucokinase